MKNLKTQLALLLLATLSWFTVAYGQVIPRRYAAARNKTTPVQSLSAKSEPMVQEQETVLYSFTGADGASPQAALIRDGEGNLYGTTAFGGLDSSYCQFYCGVVFKLDKAGNETVLYSFTGGADGLSPFGGLVRDDEGNLFGTTTGGGSASLPAGTVFKLEPPAQPGGTWTETVLHSFCSAANCTDGNTPYVGVIRDDKGNLYGTTVDGGGDLASCGGGCGVVFKLAPPAQAGGAWTETVLYSFTGGTDGGEPFASVIQDAAGNLYGTTSGGGDPACSLNYFPGCGVVFKLAPPAQAGGAWTETGLYSFTGGTDGGYPVGGVIQDAADNLYGTTLFGGLDSSYCSFDCGVVFKLDTAGNETALYSFTGLADGNNPYSG